MSARRARLQAAPPPAAGLGPTLPVLGLGAGLGGVVCLAWSWIRPHGAPAPALLGAGLAIAVISRCLGLLSGAGVEGTDELPLVGLLLGAGLAVAFVRFGPGAAPAALLTALAVTAVWWQTGLAASAARAGLLLERSARPTAAADLPAETQGAVFGLIALTAGVLLLAAALTPHAGAARLGALAVAVQVGCGAVLVAQNHHRALLRRAAAEGAEILPAPGAAPRGLAAWAGLALLALAIPVLPAPLSPHHVAAATLAFVRFVAPHGAGAVPGPAPSRPPGPGAAAAHAAGDLAPVLLVAIGALTLLLVGGTILRAVLAARRNEGGRGRSRPAGIGTFFAELWYLIRDFFAALFSGEGLQSLLALFGGAARRRRERAGGAAGGGSAGGPGAAGWRRAGDPRRRIRASYRHLLQGAGRRGLLRPAHLTPRAYGGRLQGALPRGGAELARLTAIYEEARYSPHVLGPAEAAAAESAADAVVADLGPRPPAGGAPPRGQ